MKPKIYKAGGFWACRLLDDSGIFGCGDTPSLAYEHWARQVRRRVA